MAKTQREKLLDRINAARAAGEITQQQARDARAAVKENSRGGDVNREGERAVRAILGGPSGGAGSGGGGGTGGGGRPDGGSGPGPGGGGGNSTAPGPGDSQPPYEAPEGQEWAWNIDQGWILQPTSGTTATTQACADVKGAAPEGFQWQGSYVTNADGTISDTCQLVPIAPEPPPEDTQQMATRANAREYLRGLFTQFGFSETDVTALMGQVEGWITSGLADAGTDAVLMKFRETDIYKRRFAGMAELIARGQAISEAEYIGLETSYRNVMSNYGLPTTYYDTPEDYARLIGAGLSPNEVEQRVVAAKQSMNPLVAAELREYYGIGDGDLTAYMLGLTDEQGLQLASARNQEEIRQRGRLAQIGGAAERAGFSMTREQTERLAGTSIGQTIDPFQMGTLAQLEGEFNRARRVADRETTLAAIDREAFDQRDALAAAFGDEQARLASERRAKRERARFAGSSGTAASSLGVERNF